MIGLQYLIFGTTCIRMKAPRNLWQINARNIQMKNENYIQWVTSYNALAAVTIRVYLHSFSSCCLSILFLRWHLNLIRWGEGVTTGYSSRISRHNPK